MQQLFRLLLSLGRHGDLYLLSRKSLPRLKLARLPPCSALTHRAFTFYLGNPISSIETRSAPALTRCCPGSFTFYLGNPISSILQNSVHSVEKRILRIWFNPGRTLPRAQLQWCCLPHAQWRCSYRVGGLR